MISDKQLLRLMNNKKILNAGAVLLIVMVAIGSLCSCKGRTMNNMEPTGETVEVQISPAPDSLDADSVQQADMDMEL